MCHKYITRSLVDILWVTSNIYNGISITNRLEFSEELKRTVAGGVTILSCELDEPAEGVVT